MRAVEIDGLTYTYPGAPQPTLKEISLQIEKIFEYGRIFQQ